jgi:hypothetical protein
MGDLQPENGGGGVPPDDDSYRHGVPDLPPEWGSVVVPDDPAALADEAYEVRRELRREAWRNRLRGFVGLAPSRRDAPSLGVPIVIMAVAVITTLLSLFVVTWDQRRPSTDPVGPDGALQQTALPLADVTLTDASGSRVRLGDVVPALLLLVDECHCPELINEIAAITPKPVLVVPVSTEAACVVGRTKNVWCLADPAGAVTGRYPAPLAAASSAGVVGATPTGSTDEPGAGATAGAGSTVPRPSGGPSATPVPVATGVPVDAHGVAHEPIVVTSPDDVTGALARLAAGG